MTIGSVSIWLKSHASADSECIVIGGKNDVFVHGNVADLQAFRDEITDRIDKILSSRGIETPDPMPLLKGCVDAIEAIHSEIKEYADVDPDMCSERSRVTLRVHPTEAKALYDAYHAAVNIAYPEMPHASDCAHRAQEPCDCAITKEIL